MGTLYRSGDSRLHSDQVCGRERNGERCDPEIRVTSRASGYRHHETSSPYSMSRNLYHGHWVLCSRREDRLPTLRKPGRIKSPRNISLSRYSTVAHSVIHPVHPVHTHSPSTSILVIMPSSRWVIPGSKSLDALPVRSSLKLRDRSPDSSPLSTAY